MEHMTIQRMDNVGLRPRPRGIILALAHQIG
jgi:hypothetical protein